ncbi:MAG: phosphofructokinase [Pseudonocardia sp.]|nr:phosphofructokinase [Pseudonocardia sp.]
MPASVYGRLSRDLSTNGCRVIADLSGERLEAVLEGRPFLVKVSHEELLRDGRTKDDSAGALVAAMRSLRSDGASAVVVSRAAEPALALIESEVLEIHVPPWSRRTHEGRATR